MPILTLFFYDGNPINNKNVSISIFEGSKTQNISVTVFFFVLTTSALASASTSCLHIEYAFDRKKKKIIIFNTFKCDLFELFNQQYVSN